MASPDVSPPSQVFEITNVLSHAEIRAFLDRSPLRALSGLLFTWAVIALCFVASARWPHPLVWLAAVLVLGGRQLALGVLGHDAAHRVLFTRRGLNDAVGRWLCSAPVWANLERYRATHLAHHTLTNTAQDPDVPMISPFPMPARALVGRFARDLFGATAVMRAGANLLVDLGLIAFDVEGRLVVLDRAGRSVVRDGAVNLGPALLTNAALLGALALAGHAGLYLLWVLAWATTLNAFARVRSIVDHACVPDAEHPLRNSRTVHANWLERLLVAPHGVNFHVEHHLLMTVPYYRLAALHRTLAERGVMTQACVAPGYLQVLREVVEPDRPRVTAGRAMGSPPPGALQQLRTVWRGLSGEPRA